MYKIVPVLLLIFHTAFLNAQHMVIPPYLQKGDTVGIIATARSFQPEDALPATDSLRHWGLHVVPGNTIGPEYHQLSGTDRERAADLQQMLDNPAIKAIWIARGGYGTVRIIDLIDFEHFRKKPKWIVGYSDVTVLHSHIHNMGIATLHATMPLNVKKNTPESMQSLKDGLFGKPLSYTVPARAQNRTGNGEGILTGGNLSILYSLLGSPSAIDTEGKILFIEDLDEYLYHIDRMMMNLKRNGYFDHIKGLVVGGMTRMHDNSIPWGKDAIGIVMDIADQYHFPVCFDFPAGHLQDNRALILGQRVKLQVGKEKTILSFTNDGRP
ncbi:S66 peptidase family protein [Sinomicrobium soli]|uniref:S66 peptidase family protein n=1 Tax=Sinomicrobium sp. N-1-3-6 TaxID=2219864 RepID=UPI001F2D2715|nr:LD-carboxypeptidase [Sinomicrobium sp. N-1-3-6]